jgi:hypothetical protein
MNPKFSHWQNKDRGLRYVLSISKLKICTALEKLLPLQPYFNKLCHPKATKTGGPSQPISSTYISIPAATSVKLR